MVDAGEAVEKRMLAILKATERQPSVERLATLDALATTYAACGRHRDSLALTEEAISILEAHFPERTADLFSAMGRLASGYLALDIPKTRRHEPPIDSRRQP
jgi:hypothetical protein